MNVYIIEDEVFHLEDILISLKNLGYNTIGHSNDPFEAQEQIGNLKPDVVLIDIHLNGKMAGIALANRIKSLYQIPFIFISSDSTTNVISEAVASDPVSYITKPINEKDLHAALILTQKQLTKVKNDSTNHTTEIFIKKNSKLIKIETKDILFAFSDTKNYCTIVIKKGNKFSVRNSILGLKKMLDHSTFIQTHRAYIINWQMVDMVFQTDQTIQIQDYIIPLGRTFKDSVYNKLKVI